jgi:chemotaxis protein CheD
MGPEHNSIERKGMSLKHVSIHIGEYYASSDPVVISTLLGSCVSACLYDWKNGIGGMNHILVPGKASFEKFNAAARYSINAMELLINGMMILGADRRNMWAKVFGGANVIPALSEENSVGAKNCEFVLMFLERERIQVVSRDLGGYKSRKIYFHTNNGDVYVRRSQTMKSSQIAALEQEKLKKISRQVEKPADVVWFDSSD